MRWRFWSNSSSKWSYCPFWRFGWDLGTFKFQLDRMMVTIYVLWSENISVTSCHLKTVWQDPPTTFDMKKTSNSTILEFCTILARFGKLSAREFGCKKNSPFHKWVVRTYIFSLFDFWEKKNTIHDLLKRVTSLSPFFSSNPIPYELPLNISVDDWVTFKKKMVSLLLIDK